jgi:hypothetical protein
VNFFNGFELSIISCVFCYPYWIKKRALLNTFGKFEDKRTQNGSNMKLSFQKYFLDINRHRWALSPIFVISDIGLSLISELPILDWESGVRHYIRYRNKVFSEIQYPTSQQEQTVTVALYYSPCLPFRRARVRICKEKFFVFLQCRISEWTLMSISEWRFSVRHICIWYRNNRCRCRKFDIADIEIDVNAHRASISTSKFVIFLKIF